MLISFIIPAHNEESALPATLRAIHASAAALSLSYEIIVADDASTDATAAVAAREGARVVRHHRRQISATRNLGAAAARGDALVFVDADTAIHPRTLAQSLRALDQGCVGGGAPVRFDGPVPWWASALLLILLLAFRALRYTGGAYLFCRRDALARAGGWDESVFAGEEIALSIALQRIGRFVIVRQPVITSGRKLRTHSIREIFVHLLRAVFLGRAAVRHRDNLPLWYAPRRPDPHKPTHNH